MRAVPIFLLLSLAACSADPNLAKCEAAIKAKLKAPSSYKLVSNDPPGSFMRVEYDAVNEYNAPIRRKGFCSIEKDGTAKWLPDMAADEQPNDTMTAPN